MPLLYSLTLFASRFSRAVSLPLSTAQSQLMSRVSALPLYMPEEIPLLSVPGCLPSAEEETKAASEAEEDEEESRRGKIGSSLHQQLGSRQGEYSLSLSTPFKRRKTEVTMGRSPCCDKIGVKKGPWTPEEDIILVTYIQQHGPGNWRAVPTHTGETPSFFPIYLTSPSFTDSPNP